MVAALTKWLKYCDRKYQRRFDMRGQSGAANTRLTTTSPNRYRSTFGAQKL
jgi:hypothetical protein